MKNIITFCRKHFAHDEGQTLTEYAMIILFIVVLAIVAVTLLGESIIVVMWQEAAHAL
ncbi:Flp family type IVb pilin [candidate division KSB1 bacterium]|nr:Flp family type IVb pilin [candidate division KSB1 bacterium]